MRFVELRRLHSVLTEGWRHRGRLPLRTQIRSVRLGFGPRSWVLYDLEHNDPADYLPDWAEIDFGRDRAHFRALNDKLVFGRAMAAAGLLTPRPLAFLARGRLCPFDGCSALESPGAWLFELTRSYGEVVLKPVSGMAGRGLIFLRAMDHRTEANGTEVTPAVLDALVGRLDQYVLTEFVRQADYAKTIFDGSTNTLRVLTLWDWVENRPFLAAAAHRFGSRHSAPVDNFHGGLGGLSAKVDLSTGTLSPAATLVDGATLSWCERHPDSGALIAGVVVPQWPAYVDALLRAAASFPEAPFVGWDLVATDDGPRFLEANAPPSPWVWQVHGGLLRDPRARMFFESYGLATPRRRTTEPAP